MNRLRVALLLAAVAAMLLHVWQFRDFTVDDAAISFAYARNLAQGHGLVNIAGAERVEGYTNFLWVVTLAIGFLFSGDFFLVAKVVEALMAVALVLGSAELAAALRGRRSPLDAVPAFLVAAVMPISYWAMSGLEGGLYMALGVWCAARLIVERDRPELRPWSALLAAGIALTRPDGILLLGVALVARLAGDWRWRRMIVWYALALGPVAAHLAFRYAYYAYPLPNTFYAKVHGRPFDLRELTSLTSPGWKYVQALFVGHKLAPLRYLAALTVLGFRRWYARGVVLGLFGALLAFPIYARGDWMAEWRFATPLLPLFVAMFCDGAEQLASLALAAPAWLARRWPRVVARRSLAVALIALALQVWYGKPLVTNEVESTLWRRGRYPVPAQGVLDHALKYLALARRLEIAHPSAAEGDLGGTSLAGGLRVADLGALCDVTMAQQVGNPGAIREYVLDEVRPTFFRLDGHWDGFRFPERPEFADGWTALAAPDLSGGHYIARSVFQASGVDTRAPLHSFIADGIDLLGAEVAADDARLWLLVRRLPAATLQLQSSGGNVPITVGEGLYPPAAWRAGELLQAHVRRPAGALRVCGRDGCVDLAEGASGARPVTLPESACARLLERGELEAAAAACADGDQQQSLAARLQHRGVAAEEAGDLDRGYRDLTLAIRLDPSRSFARKHIEELRTRRRDAYRPRWRLRLSEAERAFHLAPDAAHLATLAAAALAAAEPERALRAQLATSLSPSDAEARLDLAECDLLAGRPQLGLALLPPADSDPAAARIVRIAFAAGAPDRARAALARLSRTSTPVAPGLTMTAAWARPLRAGDIELSLALRASGDGAPAEVAVAGKRVPFDRAPRLWAPGEIFVHTVRLDLPAGASRVAVGRASLAVEAHAFSGDFESGRLDGWTVSGDALRGQPRDGRDPIVFGFEGYRFIDTGSRSDASAGEMRSPPLRAGLDDVCFTLAGVYDRAGEGLALEVDGQPVAVESGGGDANFREHCFELESVDGHEVRLVLFDHRAGPTRILLDDIECSSHGRPTACAGDAQVRSRY